MKKFNEKQLFAILLFVGMIFWGGSWPSSKILTQYTSTEVITFWRFFFALLTFVPIVFALKVPLRLTPSSLKYLLLASFFNSLYSILFFTGLRFGFAGAGGVLVTTLIPIFAYLLSYWLYSNPLEKHEVSGLVLGLISGLFLLNLSHYGDLLGGGNLFFVASALSWASLTLATQKIRHEVHPVAINFYTTLFSVITYAPLFLWNTNMMEIGSFDGWFWGNLLFVSCLSTAFGTTIYYQAISIVGASKASTFGLMVPVNALLLSWLFLGETPTQETLIGGSLAILAIYLINLYRPSHLQRFRRR